MLRQKQHKGLPHHAEALSMFLRENILGTSEKWMVLEDVCVCHAIWCKTSAGFQGKVHQRYCQIISMFGG